ncbi:AbrB/MazE/SpoVT family DNA-binding domain-containing protein [Candidatus Woesearchaeota archaeon]|nr:AbrB/MazE/SpoVT family DNA-binding domain-containing protein [Candidatus Woesearchaeota archaeon]
MFKSQAKLKAWGNSIGVVLPKEALKEEGLAINDEVEIILTKKTNSLKDAFGKLKNFKAKSDKSTEQLLKEIDEELKSRFD